MKIHSSLKTEDKILLKNSGDGNCAIYAICQVLGIEENPENLKNTRELLCKKVIAFKKLAAAIDNDSIKNAVKEIFEDWAIFKAVVSEYCKNSLNAPGINDESKTSIKSCEDSLSKADSWDSLENYKEIAKIVGGDFGISFEYISNDHTLGSNCSNTVYKEHASKDGTWLNNHEINAYLLSKGYVFLKQEILNDNKGTILAYKNARTHESIFLHNNSVDQGANNSIGLHWQAIKPNCEINNIEDLVDHMKEQDNLESKIKNYSAKGTAQKGHPNQNGALMKMKTKKYNFEEESGDSDEDEYGSEYPKSPYDPYEEEYSDIVYSSSHIGKRVLTDIQLNLNTDKIDNNDYIVPFFCGMPFTSDIPNSDRRNFAKKLMLLNPGLSEETKDIIKKSLGLEKTENVDDWIKSLYSDSVMLSSGTKKGGMKGIIEVSNPEATLDSSANTLKEFIKKQYTNDTNRVKTAVKRYVDDYGKNLQECWKWLQKSENENKELEKYTSGYPFVSTSKTPDHAVKFGFGAVCCDKKLEPEYGYKEQNKALPKKRLAGFVYVIKKNANDLLEELKTGEAFDVHSLQGYSIKHDGNTVLCDSHNRSQIEITFTGSIQKEDILAVIPLIYPNFSKPFDINYHKNVLHYNEKKYSSNDILNCLNPIKLSQPSNPSMDSSLFAALRNSYYHITDKVILNFLGNNTVSIKDTVTLQELLEAKNSITPKQELLEAKNSITPNFVFKNDFTLIKYDNGTLYEITVSKKCTNMHKILDYPNNLKKSSSPVNTPNPKVVNLDYTSKPDPQSPYKGEQDPISEINQQFGSLSIKEKTTPKVLNFNSEEYKTEGTEALPLENLLECVQSEDIDSKLIGNESTDYGLN